MNRLLISIDQLEKFNSAAEELFELVHDFLKRGWLVDFMAGRIGREQSKVWGSFEQHPAFIRLSEEKGELQQDYQLIWVYGGFFSPRLLKALTEKSTVGPLLFRHFFNYGDVYLPYGAAVENAMATSILTLSALGEKKLLEQEIDATKIVLQPYLITTDDITAQRRDPSELKKVLYYCESFSVEMQDIQQKLVEDGIEMDWIDSSSITQRVELNLLRSYDVVVGEETIVMRSLAAGVPAFIAKGALCEGYVTADNLEHQVAHHFSSIVSHTKLDAEEWVQALNSGFSNAYEWLASQYVILAERWSIKHAISRILDAKGPLAEFTLTEEQIDALQLHAKSLLSFEGDSYSITRWLRDRQISTTRRQVLTHMVNTHDDVANIAVVVIDNGSNNYALNLTLNSIREQTLPVRQTFILTSDKTFAAQNTVTHYWTGNWSGELNRLLANTDAHALLVTFTGINLMPDALLLLAEQRLRQPEVLMWYGDEMSVSEDCEPDIILKPDCNIDLLRSCPYIGKTLLFNTAEARQFGINHQLNEMSLFELLWQFVESAGPQAIGHVQEVMYSTDQPLDQWMKSATCKKEMAQLVKNHLTRLGIDCAIEEGMCETSQRVNYQWQRQPLISIVIPTRDRLPLLKRCIESIMEKTQWQNYELIIVDNQSSDADACDYLNQLEALALEQVRILRFPQPFNFSAINNFAVPYCRGELLLFLNNDINIIEGNWLGALAEHALRPEVGAVGACLEFDDSRIQHGGILTGIYLGSYTAFENSPADENGYLNYLKCTHNVNAVSAACMMVRKAVFEEVQGFNAEAFPLYLGDTDIGLRLRKLGYLNVWTPHARVMHMGGATRLLPEKFGIQPRPMLNDFDTLRNEWGNQLLNDITYHPLMHKIGTPFTLSQNTARFQSPLPGRPLPVVLANHVNWFGCGNHRVLQPFKAMEENLLLEGGQIVGIPSDLEVAQLDPDVILLELVTGTAIPHIIQKYRQVSTAKIIVEYDDYIPNLPLKNQNRQHFPQHIIKSMRRVMENADWIVVSTYPLAEAYGKFHHDVRVAQNRLAEKQWGHLYSERGTGKKIRVGWAGGGTHAGDLEILLPIIKELENQVEWVFMGMKPRDIKCEFHPGVPFDLYPEKLASLNLDLALVPLEMNQFNECKSNLRLLEIGTCGVPIIATNIEPYRCGLPVTLVDNKFKDWMKAIKHHINDIEYNRQQGDLLRNAVHHDWYLREQGLNEWKAAWLSS